jgi:hypothetical protein
MKLLARCLAAAALIASARADSYAQNANVQLTMKDGFVTLMVRNVPVREVLKEWARVGQTTIVNADKLTGPPVTLQIVNEPEGRALDILLRSVAGYVAAPRPTPRDDVSYYDRIAILVSSRPPAAVAAPVMAALPPPAPAHGEAAAIAAQPGMAGMTSPSAAPGEAAGFDDPSAVTSDAGAQPVPTTLAPAPPFQGVAPQLEGAQPRGMDLRTLMQNANGPTSMPRPGPLPQVPGPYKNPYQPPRPGGGGGR